MRAERRISSLPFSVNMSLRCWGLRPSGPPAELFGKERIAFATSSSVTRMVQFSLTGRMLDFRWGSGCLSLRASKVASLKGARVSSELASLTAPLKSPSSNLADTHMARNLSGSAEEWPLLEMGLLLSCRSVSSLSCLLTTVASDEPRPSLPGCLRQRVVKRRRRTHDA